MPPAITLFAKCPHFEMLIAGFDINFFRAGEDTDRSTAVYDCHREIVSLLVPSGMSSVWRTVSLPRVHMVPWMDTYS